MLNIHIFDEGHLQTKKLLLAFLHWHYLSDKITISVISRCQCIGQALTLTHVCICLLIDETYFWWSSNLRSRATSRSEFTFVHHKYKILKATFNVHEKSAYWPINKLFLIHFFKQNVRCGYKHILMVFMLPVVMWPFLQPQHTGGKLCVFSCKNRDIICTMNKLYMLILQWRTGIKLCWLNWNTLMHRTVSKTLTLELVTCLRMQSCYWPESFSIYYSNWYLYILYL